MVKKILEAGHNLTKKHWIIYTIITFIPTIWFSLIIGYYGETLKLIHIENNVKKFTSFGIGTTAIVILLPLIIAIINNWYASKSEISELEKLHNEKVFYEQLNKSVDYICEDKLKRLNQVITKTREPECSHPDIVTVPSNQLNRIRDQINECLCVFMKQPGIEYKHKDFFITIAYRFPQDDNAWRWIEGTEEKGLTLDELFDSNAKSTFNHIINDNKPYYFNNKKEDAKLDNKYIYDTTDEMNAENGGDVGSVFCCRYQVKNSKKVYAEAILSVSTYKKRFCPYIGKQEEIVSKIENTRENMLLIVKDYFGKRIGIELSLLYLEYLHNKNATN